MLFAAIEGFVDRVASGIQIERLAIANHLFTNYLCINRKPLRRQRLSGELNCPALGLQKRKLGDRTSALWIETHIRPIKLIARATLPA